MAETQCYRALIEYDGTAYYGFQRQTPEQPTIQGELEHTLNRLVQEPVTVRGSGRTDSGVHALGQVVSFTIRWRHSSRALLRALNANLPDDIAVLQLKAVSADFHPRFDARRRAYVYHVYNAPIRSPIRQRYSWHVRQPLNVERMNEAAAYLVGERDFATFGRPPQGENTVREVFQAKWMGEGDLLRFHIEATAFLYRMVRSIVGSLKLVGTGSWSVEEFVTALRACERDYSGKVAPARGLYLVSVTYDE